MAAAKRQCVRRDRVRASSGRGRGSEGLDAALAGGGGRLISRKQRGKDGIVDGASVFVLQPAFAPKQQVQRSQPSHRLTLEQYSGLQAVGAFEKSPRQQRRVEILQRLQNKLGSAPTVPRPRADVLAELKQLGLAQWVANNIVKRGEITESRFQTMEGHFFTSRTDAEIAAGRGGEKFKAACLRRERRRRDAEATPAATPAATPPPTPSPVPRAPARSDDDDGDDGDDDDDHHHNSVFTTRILNQ